jgi:hypothetical protein
MIPLNQLDRRRGGGGLVELVVIPELDPLVSFAPDHPDDPDEPDDERDHPTSSSASSSKRSNNQSLTNPFIPLHPNPQSGHPKPLATTGGRARGIDPAEEKERVRLVSEGKGELDWMWSVSYRRGCEGGKGLDDIVWVR